MDIVLHVSDVLALDYFYGYISPLKPLDTSYVSSIELNNTMTSVDGDWAWKLAKQQYNTVSNDLPTYAANLHTRAYSDISRDNIFRQALSVWFITFLFGTVLYFLFSSASYYFVYNKEQMKHPRFLKNQIALEMKLTMTSLPTMALFTAVFFLAEVRGYSKLYLDVSVHGWGYFFFQFPLFLLFTDCGVYFIHRYLHHPILYRRLHKLHHRWIVPTPFASHAFHPVDGFSQSLPYHFFPFIFPLQKYAYVALFVFVNIWTILIRKFGLNVHFLV